MHAIRKAMPAMVLLLSLTPWVGEAWDSNVAVWTSFGALFVFIVSFIEQFRFRTHTATVFGVIAALALIAQIGILQFAIQGNLNLPYIGESPISPDTAGVAKFSIGSTKLIRAYGLFPHANIFGGAMLIALIFIQHMRLPRSTSRQALHALFLISLALSFSRLAIIGYVILMCFTYGKSLLKMRSSKNVFVITILLLLFLPLLFARSFDPQSVAVSERITGYRWAAGIISSQGLFHGTGIGSYTDSLASYLNTNGVHHEIWQIAPVHSVPLLLLAELGLIPGLLVMLAGILIVIRSRCIPFIYLVPPLLFDHYFLTNISALFLLVMLYTFWNGGGISKIVRGGTTNSAS